jgi:hypothetical protein
MEVVVEDRMKAELQHIEYLGDGVYAGYDGLHIVLWLEHEGAYGSLAIALEPKVLTALAAYRWRIESKELRANP